MLTHKENASELSMPRCNITLFIYCFKGMFNAYLYAT